MVSDLLKEKEELVDENESLKAKIEEMKHDVNEYFGYEYNILVAKLFNKWETKENESKQIIQR